MFDWTIRRFEQAVNRNGELAGLSSSALQNQHRLLQPSRPQPLQVPAMPAVPKAAVDLSAHQAGTAQASGAAAAGQTAQQGTGAAPAATAAKQEPAAAAQQPAQQAATTAAAAAAAVPAAAATQARDTDAQQAAQPSASQQPIPPNSSQAQRQAQPAAAAALQQQQQQQQQASQSWLAERKRQLVGTFSGLIRPSSASGGRTSSASQAVAEDRRKVRRGVRAGQPPGCCGRLPEWRPQ